MARLAHVMGLMRANPSLRDGEPLLEDEAAMRLAIEKQGGRTGRGPLTRNI